MRSSTRRDFLRQAGTAAAAGALLWPGAAGASEGAPPERPNILFLFPDQHRFDWTGANPRVPVRTPVLDRLAARGVRFERAYCASPLCGPSRACLAAGREYDTCGVPNHGIPFPLDRPTFYRALRAHGYHVLGVGKFDLDKGATSWGLDGRTFLPEWGFSDGINNAGKWDAMYAGEPRDPFNVFLARTGLREVHAEDMRRRRDVPPQDARSFGHYRATHPTPLPEHAYCDNWIGANGLDLLRQAPADRPWFLQVNFAGPHEPMDVTARMAAAMRARGAVFPQPYRNTQLDAAHHQALRQNYAAMIENIDRWLGLYLDELDRRGELDRTLVVFSSDHGEMLGDRDRWAKSMPYEASIGVPLVVAGPGVLPGRQSRALVSLIDLTATFLEVGGAPPLEGMQGQSLMPVLSGAQETHREVVRSGLYGWRVVREGSYKLVVGFDEETGPERNDGVAALEGPVGLFDLEEDPWEERNLAGAMPERVRRMSALLIEEA